MPILHLKELCGIFHWKQKDMYYCTMKTMRTLILLLIFLFIRNKTYSQQKVTDTIYFDKDWKICEKPIAEYYRAGEIAMLDSMLYYTGPFKDYTYDNRLVTEGIYAKGRKNGLFTFYYPNGVVQCAGKYEQDSLLGVWRWNYADGKERASIYFPGIEQEFKFITYKDDAGNSLLENGKGNFVWETLPFDATIKQVVHGSFDAGIRVGEWKYTSPDTKRRSDLYEFYDNGKLGTGAGISLVNKVSLTVQTPFQFTPQRIVSTESLAYNKFFLNYGGENFPRNMISYLADKKPYEIDMADMDADSVYTNIVQMLVKNIDILDRSLSFNDTKIGFGISGNGRLENITITGVSNQERKHILYYLEKFKNIHIPAETGLSPAGRFAIYINSYSHQLRVFTKTGFVVKDITQLLVSSLPRVELEKLFEDRFAKEKYLGRGYFIRYL